MEYTTLDDNGIYTFSEVKLQSGMKILIISKETFYESNETINIEFAKITISYVFR